MNELIQYDKDRQALDNLDSIPDVLDFSNKAQTRR